MVVRREKRAGAGSISRMQVFNYSPCNREAIVSASASSDLVEDDEAALGRVVENVSRLVHLDHESRVASSQLIARTNAGKNTVDHS